MEDRYFKFMLTVPPKPIPTHLMIEVFNKVWSWAKKYRGLKNGTKDCFTEETQTELIQGHDEIIKEYPFPFTENLLTTFLKEFRARDEAGYKFSVDNDSEHDVDVNEIIEEEEEIEINYQ